MKKNYFLNLAGFGLFTSCLYTTIAVAEPARALEASPSVATFLTAEVEANGCLCNCVDRNGGINTASEPIVEFEPYCAQIQGSYCVGLDERLLDEIAVPGTRQCQSIYILPQKWEIDRGIR